MKFLWWLTSVAMIAGLGYFVFPTPFQNYGPDMRVSRLNGCKYYRWSEGWTTRDNTGKCAEFNTLAQKRMQLALNRGNTVLTTDNELSAFWKKHKTDPLNARWDITEVPDWDTQHAFIQVQYENRTSCIIDEVEIGIEGKQSKLTKTYTSENTNPFSYSLLSERDIEFHQVFDIQPYTRFSAVYKINNDIDLQDDTFSWFIKTIYFVRPEGVEKCFETYNPNDQGSLLEHVFLLSNEKMNALPEVK